MKRPKKPFLFKRRLVVNPWNQNVGRRLATKGSSIRTIVVSDFSALNTATIVKFSLKEI
jgi:hypothetical protein